MKIKTVDDDNSYRPSKFRSKWLAVGIVMIVLASVVSATLVILSFQATMDKDVPTPGIVGESITPIDLQVKKFWHLGSGDGWQWVDLGNLVGEIPVYLNKDMEQYPLNEDYCDGIIENGETTVVKYELNNINSHNYNISMNISDYWFEDPEHEYYGFTYGIRNATTMQDLNGVIIPLIPGETYRFDIWYSADFYYKQPTNATTPIHIDIDSWGN